MVFSKDLYENFKEFMKQSDDKMHQLILKIGYLKPLPKRDWFSILVGNVIGQKIRFHRARELRGKLYTLLKKSDFTADDFKVHANKQTLMKLGIEEWQVDIILRVFAFITMHNISDFDDIDRLIEVKGIGLWTLRNTKLMYSLQTDQRETVEDVLLTRDLIIRRGIQKMYNVTSKKDIEQLESKWSPYNGLVTWYLWKEFS